DSVHSLSRRGWLSGGIRLASGFGFHSSDDRAIRVALGARPFVRARLAGEVAAGRVVRRGAIPDAAPLPAARPGPRAPARRGGCVLRDHTGGGNIRDRSPRQRLAAGGSRRRWLAATAVGRDAVARGALAFAGWNSWSGRDRVADG